MLNTQFTRRRAVSLALTSGFALALSACGKDDPATSATPGSSVSGSPATTPAASTAPSASGSASASATPTVKPTVIANLDAITVDPVAPGKLPKVTGKWPLAVEKTQVKVLTPGTGAVVPKGATVEVNYHGINGRTGKPFDSSMDEQFGHKAPATFPLTGVVAGFTKAIEGQKVGSRVLVMMTGQDGYGSQGGNPQAGIEKDDCLLFVIDILASSVTGPSGEAVAPKAGLPKVTDAKGVPSVEIPKTATPTSLVVQPLVKGTGKKIAATDAVTVHYRAWDWATGKLLLDDYSNAAGETGAIAQLVEAWKQGLVGQTVGSRVLLIAPPATAYGEAGVDGKIPKNATLVYVVDLLFSQPAQQG